MAACLNPTLLCTNKSSLNLRTTTHNTVSHKLHHVSIENNTTLSTNSLSLVKSVSVSVSGNGSTSSGSGRGSFAKVQAGLTEIEPDINEDYRDPRATNGVAPEDFVYGVYDDHHTYFETSEKVSVWEGIAEAYNSMDPPTGLQGIMSWLFLPAVAAGMYYDIPGDYIFLGAGVFIVVFCAFEMAKPDQPHNFEPQIYNMERGSRDKLISDYNTMDIWDFNEKYGELWDFTVQHDDMFKK